jgi:hypothetical protein
MRFSLACAARAEPQRSLAVGLAVAAQRSTATYTREPSENHSAIRLPRGPPEDLPMSRSFLLAILVSAPLVGAAPGGAAKPDDPKPVPPKVAPRPTDANPENIEAALRLTVLAAGEYEFRVGTDEKQKPLTLIKEPVLKWSNPDRGEVHGNVFLWTREGRPLMVGSLYKWFTPHTHMSHEFQSLAERPIRATFHGKEVWNTAEAGVGFAPVPKAPAPAATEAQRLIQAKQLVKEFSGAKIERDDPKTIELRLFPQPIHRYAAPNDGIHFGALFTLVHGTDPEIFILLEARGKDAESANWQYAVTRMNSVAMWLHHKDQKVWSVETLPWVEVHNHKHAYTVFGFKEIPDFLKDALNKPR